ncbi:MAG: TerB family tellurite resistance protein [Candidatus Binatia bacterium]|nr:TerB family tellurite resistance protein [Candidatus Binatia bacterium]
MEHPMDPAAALARLAMAVMVADGRITSEELATAAVLDELGLGPMRPRLLAELEQTRSGRLELEPAIAALAALSPRARAVIFEVLAELAAADGDLSQTEAALLDRLAARWDLEPATSSKIPPPPLRSEDKPSEEAGVKVPIRTSEAEARSSSTMESGAAPTRFGDGLPPELVRALEVLGLPPDASPAAVDEAFRALVHRYDPAHVIDLGPEFAVLAIRRLGQIADAYLTWKRLEHTRPS